LAMIEEKLSIEVTTHCNIDCSFCFARAGNAERSRLSTTLVRQIINEGYNSGYRRLHITGGEPLLWKGIFGVLDYAFSLGYKTVFINTNGTLITENIAKRLAGYRYLRISVSLDGGEDLHNQLRGDDSYRRAVQGIAAAHDADVGLYIFSIACKSFCDDLPNFAKDIYRRFPHIKCLTLIPLMNFNDEVGALSGELPDPDDILHLAKTAALLNLGGFKIDFLNYPLINIVSKLLEVPWMPKAFPLYRDGSMIVMANQEIRLAHSSCDIFGRYAPGMIERILSSNEYQKAVAPNKTTCIACDYLELCRKYDLIHPLETLVGRRTHMPFCRQVLDRIAQ